MSYSASVYQVSTSISPTRVLRVAQNFPNIALPSHKLTHSGNGCNVKAVCEASLNTNTFRFNLVGLAVSAGCKRETKDRATLAYWGGLFRVKSPKWISFCCKSLHIMPNLNECKPLHFSAHTLPRHGAQ